MLSLLANKIAYLKVISQFLKRRKSRSRKGLLDRCRPNYCNTLPDIPSDPKFLKFQHDPNRFLSYQYTSLEKNFKLELNAEPNLGVNIDLIDPRTYAIDARAKLHPDDAALLEDETPTPARSKRSQNHSMNVSWLRKSEYISHGFNRCGTSSSNFETRIGPGVKKILQEEES